MKLFLFLLFIFSILQFYPIDRSQKVDRAVELKANKRVKSILKRACYDCHSNQVRWSLYSYIFPASYFISKNIEKGKENLNFSEWEDLSYRKKSILSFDIVENIESKKMPLKLYLFFYPEARINTEELLILKKWAKKIDMEYEENEGD